MFRHAFLALLVAAAPALAQTEIVVGGFCAFDGDSIGDRVYGFDSDDDAETAIRDITRHTGLQPNFTIRAANVPNAAAVIDGNTGERLILYSQEFMRAVRERTASDWSEVSILAHELGHHLQGHTLLAGGSRPPIELEADQFSGFVLQRMGATLDDALRAMRAIASEEGSDTHPPRSARLAAITNGYIDSEGLSGGRRGPSGPDAPTRPTSDGGQTRPTEPPPAAPSTDVPDETDFEGQVRYQLDSFHRAYERQGYARTVEAHTARIDADARERFTIDLEAGVEYQIVATCDNDCTDIDLFLYDPADDLVDSDQLDDDIPIVSVTPDRDGRYAIEGLMYECETSFCYVGIGVWARAAGSSDRFGNDGGADDNEWAEYVRGAIGQAREHLDGQGYRQAGSTQVGVVEAEGVRRFEFEAGGAGRVLAVCDQDCADVDLMLYDEAGELVDSDQLDDDVPIVEVPGAGRYTAEVRMYECSADVCYYGAGLFRQ